VSGRETRPRKFENFKFFSLLQNKFFLKKYIDIVPDYEARPVKFENFKFFSLLQNYFLM